MESHISIGRVHYKMLSKHFIPHQKHYQVFVLENGRAECELEDLSTGQQQSLSLRSGEVMVLRPGFAYSFLFVGPRGSVHSWLSLYTKDPDLLYEGFTIYQTPPLEMGEAWHRAVAMTPLLDQHLSFLEEMHRRSDKGLRYGSFVLQACLFFEHVAQECYHVFEQQGVPKSLRDIEAYIQSHYKEPLQLQDLVDEFHTSRDTILRMFKKHRQSTPTQVLWSTRVEAVLEMIASSSLSLEEIALQCGFANAQHLSRKVKEITGRSPKSYRKR